MDQKVSYTLHLTFRRIRGSANIYVKYGGPSRLPGGGDLMAQKLATVSTVFAACDRLDAANERWNREDVRSEVGGGGYVVIDPLIRAWRSLKPLRAAHRQSCSTRWLLL